MPLNMVSPKIILALRWGIVKYGVIKDYAGSQLSDRCPLEYLLEKSQ